MAKNNKFEIKSKVGLIFKLVWLAFALIMFFCGLTVFLNGKTDEPFVSWILWGVFCAFPVIIPMIKIIIDLTKSNARAGAKDVTIVVSNTGAYAKNNSFMSGVVGLFLSVFASILAGPIVLGGYIFINILAIISYLLKLWAEKKHISEAGNGDKRG